MKKSLMLLALVAIVAAGTALAGDKTEIVYNQSQVTPTPVAYPISEGDRVDLVFESFENEFPPTGWTTMTSGESYTWVQSNAWARSGAYSAYVQYGPQGAWQDEWLITPALDTNALGMLILEFYESEVYWDGYGLVHYVMVSTTVPDDPAAFTSVLEMTPSNHVIDPDVPVVVDLSDYVGYDTVYVAVRYTGDWADDWWVDDFYLFEPSAHDAKAVAVMPDGEIWVAGSEITPQFVVKNNGMNTETFDVTMDIEFTGAPFYSETMAVTDLPPGETVTVDFPTFACDVGVYDLTAMTMLDGDEEPSNDTATASNACFSGQRTPFGILYTEWGCGPCVPANQALDAWYPEQGNDASLIRVHVWWPAGNDPMYHANVEQNEYLHGMCPTVVNGVPTLYMDNTIDMWDYFQEDWPATVVWGYDWSAATATPLTVEIGYDTEYSQAHVLVNVLDPMPDGDYRLFVAVTEDGIELQGPNGEPIHNQVFRYLYPDTDGIAIDTAIGVQEFVVDLDLNPEWVFDNLRATAWVQAIPGGPVLNSGTLFLHEGTVAIDDDEIVDDIVDPDEVPQLATRLEGAHPNPFNPMTTLRFTLDRAQHVTLSVFDMTGRKIAELANGTFAEGSHPVQWNGQDTSGRDVSSGTYLVQMETEGGVQSSKMMLVR